MISESKIHSKARGIVVFNDLTALLWENEDGGTVIQWVLSFDSPKSAHAAAHRGVHHAVVYQLINYEVIYETEH